MKKDVEALSETEASWLKSPVTEKSDRLKPMNFLMLEPYQGSRRKLRIYRTHYLIGSGEECDIRLQDPFVSARHAELVLEEEGYQVVDLNSRNGVYLNGIRVKVAPLSASGILRIGRSNLHWRDKPALENEGDLIVADPFMKKTIERLRVVAKSSLPVLLLGETGTGKEILARILHGASQRSDKPYVAVNGALTGGSLAESELFGHKKGAFTGAENHRLGALRSAQGGTLFLDEVGDIPGSAQAKLLRALESGEVKSLGSDQKEKIDFRLVSATSHNMDRKISDGIFRQDLYYRLAGYVVHIPPLRERPLDILAIARSVVRESRLGLDKEAEAKLLSYRWPGNVRELRSCLGRATVMAEAERSGRVLREHLFGLDREVQSDPRDEPHSTLEALERNHIQRSLERNGWSKTVVAQELGIARSTLFQKMRRYGFRASAE